MRIDRFFRHVLAVLVLPVVVVVAVPLWVTRRSGVEPALPGSAGGWISTVVGGVLMLAGVVLFGACLGRFVRDGLGTLAPWDPPVHLVKRGPYAFVRNPMITSVVLLLLGEAMLLRSGSLLTWAAGFAAANAVYLPWVEEPSLRRRFGSEYDEYAAHVPRLIPRWRPWRSSRPRPSS